MEHSLYAIMGTILEQLNVLDSQLQAIGSPALSPGEKDALIGQSIVTNRFILEGVSAQQKRFPEFVPTDATKNRLAADDLSTQQGRFGGG